MEFIKTAHQVQSAIYYENKAKLKKLVLFNQNCINEDDNIEEQCPMEYQPATYVILNFLVAVLKR